MGSVESEQAEGNPSASFSPDSEIAETSAWNTLEVRYMDCFPEKMI
jgi:hypothetical protein